MSMLLNARSHQGMRRHSASGEVEISFSNLVLRYVYNDYVAGACARVEGVQHEPSTTEEAAQLAGYVRKKLGLAVSLACEAEQARRSGHWAFAEEYQRQWEVVIAEVKRLLPLVRQSGVSLFGTGNREQPRSGRTGR
jgi:hypothetical protein